MKGGGGKGVGGEGGWGEGCGCVCVGVCSARHLDVVGAQEIHRLPGPTNGVMGDCVPNKTYISNPIIPYQKANQITALTFGGFRLLYSSASRFVSICCHEIALWDDILHALIMFWS